MTTIITGVRSVISAKVNKIFLRVAIIWTCSKLSSPKTKACVQAISNNVNLDPQTHHVITCQPHQRHLKQHVLATWKFQSSPLVWNQRWRWIFFYYKQTKGTGQGRPLKNYWVTCLPLLNAYKLLLKKSKKLIWARWTWQKRSIEKMNVSVEVSRWLVLTKYWWKTVFTHMFLPKGFVIFWVKEEPYFKI